VWQQQSLALGSFLGDIPPTALHLQCLCAAAGFMASRLLLSSVAGSLGLGEGAASLGKASAETGAWPLGACHPKSGRCLQSLSITYLRAVGSNTSLQDSAASEYEILLSTEDVPGTVLTAMCIFTV
jgi:hypothetical protein